MLFGSVGTPNVDRAIVAGSADPHAPRIAADLAVLNERPPDIGLEIDLDLFTAVRAGDGELIHGDQLRT